MGPIPSEGANPLSISIWKQNQPLVDRFRALLGRPVMK